MKLISPYWVPDHSEEEKKEEKEEKEEEEEEKEEEEEEEEEKLFYQSLTIHMHRPIHSYIYMSYNKL